MSPASSDAPSRGRSRGDGTKFDLVELLRGPKFSSMQSESASLVQLALMGIRDFGEWKAYASQRFVGILHITVRNSLATRSPIPDWAAEKVRESWNV